MNRTIKAAAGAALLVGALALAAGPATAQGDGTTPNDPSQTEYHTVVVSPHPDDETRLAPYLAMAADRGDSLVLIQVTNGAGTAVRGREGLTHEEVTRYRYREQRHAWEWATDGRGGEIIYLDQDDANTDQAQIEEALLEALQQAEQGRKPEIYVAAYPHNRGAKSVYGDQHQDHINTWQAAAAIGAEHGYTVRYARHSQTFHLPGGMVYEPQNNQQRLRVEGSFEAWGVIGHRSARSTFDSLEAWYRTVIEK